MTKPYTHEMVIIHRVFRREAALLPRLAGGVRPGDIQRAGRIAAAIREYAGGLHHHHGLEDELIWPKLHARARLYDELVTRMQEQHHRLDATLRRINQIAPRWEIAATDYTREALVVALQEHLDVLTEHLDDEEEHILPLIAEHLSVAEWDEVGRRGLETIPKSKVMLALGAILEDATEAEQRYFMSKVPAPGRLLWRLAGRRQYQRFTDELRGATV
ncbi:hemerythrin domain-containing protein [Actinoplanes sp. NPDC026619]|uniref:hemerythrin domain-containing protein n=1 Tax=Actinoplanes sp. NPDC026619 TaxID=3155798 RepID=UPI0033E59C8D